MITAAVLDILTLIIGGLLDALPVTTPPAWISTGVSYMPQVFTFAASMGVWFPWSLLGIVLAAVVTTWVGGFVVKVVRIVISHVTGGGGSAS